MKSIFIQDTLPGVWKFLNDLNDAVEHLIVAWEVDKAIGIENRISISLNEKLIEAQANMANGRISVGEFLHFMANVYL
jgi:hypothetical protein